METFTKFLYDFLGQFFSGIRIIFQGLGKGLKETVNIGSYSNIIQKYKGDFSMPEWILVAIAVGLILLIFVLVGLLIFLTIRKYGKIRKKTIDQDAMLQEIASLNGQVAKLVKEKDEILAMKVSQLGLKPLESAEEEQEESAKVKLPAQASVACLGKT